MKTEKMESIIMKEMCNLALAIIAAVVVCGCMTGCQSYLNVSPLGAVEPVQLAELKTTATYDIIGEAQGSATGGRLFGFIPVGGENKVGQVGSMIIVNPVVRAAIYNAIESVPTADTLLAPRYSIKSSNYIIYSEQTVTVKGKAVRYNKSNQ